jgi:hypothetical protein
MERCFEPPDAAERTLYDAVILERPTGPSTEP